MTTYVEHIRSLLDKKVALLVTHFFPAAWGANQTIATMRQACEAKGATVCGSGDVRWFGPGRTDRITKALESLTRCLGA